MQAGGLSRRNLHKLLNSGMAGPESNSVVLVKGQKTLKGPVLRFSLAAPPPVQIRALYGAHAGCCVTSQGDVWGDSG